MSVDSVRVEAPKSSIGGSVVRDEDFWLSDGNIVLVVQTRAFRVHKSVLSRSSDVFRDVFALSQPSNFEQFEGYPMISLSDQAVEVRHLLHALYDSGQCVKAFHCRLPFTSLSTTLVRYVMPNQRMEFSVVAALIRLGHKYQMTALRDAALARLQTCFTTSFAVWAELTRYEPHRSASMSFRRRDAIAVVNLARLTGTASVLPGALYLCCQLSAQELVSGLHGPDGVCERLAPDDLARCIDGRSALLSHTAHVVARILSPSVSVHCLEPPACRVTLEACLQSFQSPESKALQSHDVLQSWEDAFDTYGVPMERLCEKCFDLLWLREFQERQKIWKILPELMGVEVPDWLAKSE